MEVDVNVVNAAREGMKEILDDKPRLEGVVTGIDQAMTTAFVKAENGKQYLAFRLNPYLRENDRIEFTADAMRATRVKVIPS